MSQSLFSLDTIHVASPCHAAWDDMEGDDRTRFCRQCRRTVYNLSGMTRQAAIELVAEQENQVCVRFFRRGDGTLLTRDCPVGVRNWRRRLFVGASAAALLLAALVVWSVGLVISSGAAPPPEEQRVGAFQRIWEMFFPPPPPPPMLGKICIDDPKGL
jgi:hypothetical protein